MKINVWNYFGLLFLVFGSTLWSMGIDEWVFFQIGVAICLVMGLENKQEKQR